MEIQTLSRRGISSRNFEEKNPSGKCRVETAAS
jgi:hypothetical protein